MYVRCLDCLFLSSRGPIVRTGEERFVCHRFYCDSSAGLDEHNQTHTVNMYAQSVLDEPAGLPVPMTTTTTTTTITKSSEPSHGPAHSEKSTPPSKAKVHRCRQCSFVSSVKVGLVYESHRESVVHCFFPSHAGRLLGTSSCSHSSR